MLGNGPPVLGPSMFTSAVSATGAAAKVVSSSLLLMGVIDRYLEARRRRRGRGQVGNLEGSNGPRRVVQSLWSGAAAAVHRLACPRPVSGLVGERRSRPVADVVGMHTVVITMQRSPAGGQSKPPARRNVDIVLRLPHADKRLRNRRIAVRPSSAPHTLGTHR